VAFIPENGLHSLLTYINIIYSEYLLFNFKLFYVDFAACNVVSIPENILLFFLLVYVLILRDS